MAEKHKYYINAQKHIVYGDPPADSDFQVRQVNIADPSIPADRVPEIANQLGPIENDRDFNNRVAEAIRSLQGQIDYMQVNGTSGGGGDSGDGGDSGGQNPPQRGEKGDKGDKGDDGEDAYGIEYIYAAVNTSTLQANQHPDNAWGYRETRGDGIEHNGVTWRSAPPSLTVDARFLFRAQRRILGTLADDATVDEDWLDPPTVIGHFAVDGAAGARGEDAVGYEYVWTTSAEDPLPASKYPNVAFLYGRGGTEGGQTWTTTPGGISAATPYLYQSERQVEGFPNTDDTIPAVNVWSQPAIVGNFARDGRDGDPGEDGADALPYVWRIPYRTLTTKEDEYKEFSGIHTRQVLAIQPDLAGAPPTYDPPANEFYLRAANDPFHTSSANRNYPHAHDALTRLQFLVMAYNAELNDDYIANLYDNLRQYNHRTVRIDFGGEYWFRYYFSNYPWRSGSEFATRLDLSGKFIETNMPAGAVEPNLIQSTTDLDSGQDYKSVALRLRFEGLQRSGVDPTIANTRFILPKVDKNNKDRALLLDGIQDELRIARSYDDDDTIIGYKVASAPEAVRSRRVKFSNLYTRQVVAGDALGGSPPEYNPPTNEWRILAGINLTPHTVAELASATILNLAVNDNLLNYLNGLTSTDGIHVRLGFGGELWFEYSFTNSTNLAGVSHALALSLTYQSTNAGSTTSTRDVPGLMTSITDTDSGENYKSVPLELEFIYQNESDYYDAYEFEVERETEHDKNALANAYPAGRFDELTGKPFDLLIPGVGTKGDDGIGIEYIYTAFSSDTLPQSKYPDNAWLFDAPGTVDGQVWYDAAPNVTTANRYLFQSQRQVSGVSNIAKSNWTQPKITGYFAADGLDGQDGGDGEPGVGLEYIFAVHDSDTLLESQQPDDAWAYDAPQTLNAGTDDEIAWSDGAPGVSAANPYLWQAQRRVSGNPLAPLAGEVWTDAKIIGRFGTDGVGVEYVYAKYTTDALASTQLPDNSWGYGVDGTRDGVVWTNQTPAVDVDNPLLLRSERRVSGTPSLRDVIEGEWTTPIVLGRFAADGATGARGEDGVPGLDAAGIERIFTAFATDDLTTNSAYSAKLPDNDWAFDAGGTADGQVWSDGAPSISAATPYMYQSQRNITGSGGRVTILDNWTTPVVVAHFGIDGLPGARGQDGADAFGFEYVYAARATADDIPLANRPFDIWGYDSAGDRNGLTWHDAAPEINVDKPYLFQSQRKITGAPNRGDTVLDTSDADTRWTTPVVVAHFGIDGLPGARGQDGADGSDATGFETIFTAYSSATLPASRNPLNSWGFDNPASNGGQTWYDAAPGLTAVNKYLFQAQRKVVGTPDHDADVSDNWTAPKVVGRFATDGATGAGGASVEYIFTTHDTDFLHESRYPDNAWGYDTPGTRGGQTWTDGAEDLTAGKPFLFRSYRPIIGTPARGAAISGAWSTPVIVGKFGEDANNLDIYPFNLALQYNKRVTRANLAADNSGGYTIERKTGESITFGKRNRDLDIILDAISHDIEERMEAEGTTVDTITWQAGTPFYYRDTEYFLMVCEIVSGGGSNQKYENEGYVIPVEVEVDKRGDLERAIDYTAENGRGFSVEVIVGSDRLNLALDDFKLIDCTYGDHHLWLLYRDERVSSNIRHWVIAYSALNGSVNATASFRCNVVSADDAPDVYPDSGRGNAASEQIPTGIAFYKGYVYVAMARSFRVDSSDYTFYPYYLYNPLLVRADGGNNPYGFIADYQHYASVAQVPKFYSGCAIDGRAGDAQRIWSIANIGGHFYGAPLHDNSAILRAGEMNSQSTPPGPDFIEHRFGVQHASGRVNRDWKLPTDTHPAVPTGLFMHDGHYWVTSASTVHKEKLNGYYTRQVATEQGFIDLQDTIDQVEWRLFAVDSGGDPLTTLPRTVAEFKAHNRLRIANKRGSAVMDYLDAHKDDGVNERVVELSFGGQYWFRYRWSLNDAEDLTDSNYVDLNLVPLTPDSAFTNMGASAREPNVMQNLRDLTSGKDYKRVPLNFLFTYTEVRQEMGDVTNTDFDAIYTRQIIANSTSINNHFFTNPSNEWGMKVSESGYTPTWGPDNPVSYGDFQRIERIYLVFNQSVWDHVYAHRNDDDDARVLTIRNIGTSSYSATYKWSINEANIRGTGGSEGMVYPGGSTTSTNRLIELEIDEFVSTDIPAGTNDNTTVVLGVASRNNRPTNGVRDGSSIDLRFGNSVVNILDEGKYDIEGFDFETITRTYGNDGDTFTIGESPPLAMREGRITFNVRDKGNNNRRELFEAMRRGMFAESKIPFAFRFAGGAQQGLESVAPMTKATVNDGTNNHDVWQIEWQRSGSYVRRKSDTEANDDIPLYVPADPLNNAPASGVVNFDVLLPAQPTPDVPVQRSSRHLFEYIYSAALAIEIRDLAPEEDWPADWVAYINERIDGLPQNGDLVTAYRGEITVTRAWNSYHGKWIPFAGYVGGNLIVRGGVTSEHVATNSLDARNFKAETGSLQDLDVSGDANVANLFANKFKFGSADGRIIKARSLTSESAEFGFVNSSELIAPGVLADLYKGITSPHENRGASDFNLTNRLRQRGMRMLNLTMGVDTELTSSPSADLIVTLVLNITDTEGDPIVTETFTSSQLTGSFESSRKEIDLNKYFEIDGGYNLNLTIRGTGNNGATRLVLRYINVALWYM